MTTQKETLSFHYRTNSPLHQDVHEHHVEQRARTREHPEPLGAASRVNLKMMFPVSFRYTVQRCGGLGITVAILLAAYLWVYGLHGLLHPNSELKQIAVVCLGSLSALFLFRLMYQELYRNAFQYETDGFRLVITRGVLFKNEGSLPLLPVSEIYVTRTVKDFLFGLYQVHVATPVNAAKAFGLIQGLSYEDAHALQSFLSKQLNRQIFIADKPEEPVLQ